jgi:hypothetical protein
MSLIDYDVQLMEQGFQECTQTSAAQILKYYGIDKTTEEIKKEVPVYINKEGKHLGSSLGHIATYFVSLGLKTTIHTVDMEIFDRSWKDLSNFEMVEKLQERRKYFHSIKYEDEALDVIFDGYIKFLQAGGKVVFPIIDEKYLVNLLENGPIYGVVSYNFLNSTSKITIANGVGDPIYDSVQGSCGTHVITIAGHNENHQFKLVDSDPKFGGIRWVESGLLIGSIYLAETDYDSLLITVRK